MGLQGRKYLDSSLGNSPRVSGSVCEALAPASRAPPLRVLQMCPKQIPKDSTSVFKYSFKDYLHIHNVY